MHTKQIRYECRPSTNLDFERSGVTVLADIWKTDEKVTVNVLLVDEGASVSQLVLFETSHALHNAHPLSDDLMVNNIVRQRLLALLAVVPFADEIVDNAESKGVLEWYTYVPFGAVSVRLDVYQFNDRWKVNVTTGDFSSPFDEHMMNHTRIFSATLMKTDFPTFNDARQELISRFYIECAGMITDISTITLKENDKEQSE